MSYRFFSLGVISKTVFSVRPLIPFPAWNHVDYHSVFVLHYTRFSNVFLYSLLQTAGTHIPLKFAYILVFPVWLYGCHCLLFWYCSFCPPCRIDYPVIIQYFHLHTALSRRLPLFSRFNASLITATVISVLTVTSSLFILFRGSNPFFIIQCLRKILQLSVRNLYVWADSYLCIPLLPLPYFFKVLYNSFEYVNRFSPSWFQTPPVIFSLILRLSLGFFCS